MANERSKAAAATAAVGLVQAGMIVGLGTGSTSELMLQQLALRVGGGLQIQAVATSRAIAQQARDLGVPLVAGYPDFQHVDITLDGADEVDPQGRLIKGGGGALLQEKLVAVASRQLVIMVDEGKLVQCLGQAWAVPVEVIPFGWSALQKRIEALGAGVKVRQAKEGPFVTDQGNYIMDCHFGRMTEPEQVHRRLIELPGVVETGLFLNLTNTLVVGCEDGTVSVQDFRRS